MNNVTIGTGKLAGQGVYAARDFEKGELVVPYNLKPLTQAEFDALPMSEREWTHSFYGKIFLFPEPARYVNHDDDPSTYPDLERQGNYALRPIKKGEAITINDHIELMHELETFLEAYEKAANRRDFANAMPLIADSAEFWFTNGTFKGKAEIQKAFEDTWVTIKDETYTISNVQWVATNYWVSACTYIFKSDGMVDGKRQIYEGKGTNVLARLDGSWRVVHEHLSKEEVS
jgi:ketosteroid isomerase-like protein